MSNMLNSDDLARLRLAAEDAGWLIARGYPSDDVTGFVAKRRALSESEQLLLARASAGSAHLKHHIARELDPEDVSRRPLRIDAASVIATIEAGLAGGALLETAAGVLLDPSWRRADYQPGPQFASALERLVAALAGLRPKSIRWVVAKGDDALHASLAAQGKVGKAKAELAAVDDVVEALSGAAFVASSDPAVLDGVGTWVNAAALSLDGEGPRLRLHEG